MKDLYSILNWMQMLDRNGTFSEAANDLRTGTLTAADLIPALLDSLETWTADSAGTALERGCNEAIKTLEALTGTEPENRNTKRWRLER